MTKNRFPQALPAIRFGMQFLLAATLVMTALRYAEAQEDTAEAATEQIYFDQLEYRQLPAVRINRLLEEDKKAIKRLEGRTSPPVRIAAPAATTPFTLEHFSGHATKSGYISLLGLRSKGALGQSLQITRFDMPEGTKLWVYDPKRKFPAGPYAPTTGSENQVIWTPAIAGEKLVVQIESRERPRPERDGLEIRTVMQTYRGAGAQVGPNGISENPCQKDVCMATQANPAWAGAARAVSVYTVIKSSADAGAQFPVGTYTCTGTLLNNTNTPRKDYILSANHCLQNLTDSQPDNTAAKLANTITFYWDFKASCGGAPHNGGPPSTIYPYTSGGAVIKASWPLLTQVETDFMLLDPINSTLHNPPGSSYSYYHAGWNATLGAAPTSAFGLHHPQGDVMAYSVSSATPISVQHASNNDCPNCNFWLVTWASSAAINGGTGTERGSSGSCLFDASGLCVGMLWGRQNDGQHLSCSTVTSGDPIGLHSEYGKFSASWNPANLPSTAGACLTASTADKQKSLRCWLDPNDTLPGSPPSMTGDTHITTTNGALYHFQAAGEFVALREPGGLEVQTRQSAVSNSPHVDPTTGLNLCVSINTAVAARVGKHRVTYQPSPSAGSNSGQPLLELRVDGKLQNLGSAPLELEGDGRIVPQDGQGNIQIHFPDHHVLTVTATPWSNVWFLNVDLQRAVALSGGDGDGYSLRGIAGPIAAGEWLPDLPDGTPMGTLPVDGNERYKLLYTKFADEWRVKPGSSLFDYAPGTSTDTYTVKSWPMPQNNECVVPGQAAERVVRAATKPDPKAACGAIKGERERSNCEFDVEVANNAGVAKGYEASQRIRTGGTVVTVQEIKPHRFQLLRAHFLATVRPSAPTATTVPAGAVIFMVDGRDASKSIDLDAHGQAKWSIWRLKARHHLVSVRYTPSSKERVFLRGNSAGVGGPNHKIRLQTIQPQLTP